MKNDSTQAQPQEEREPLNAAGRRLFPATIVMVACDQCDAPRPWPLTCGHSYVQVFTEQYVRADLPRATVDKDDYDLAYAIMEEMGLGFKVRNCSCGQLPCLRLRPIADALAKRKAEVRAAAPRVETGLTVEAWLPIETAPRDVPSILIYCPESGGVFQAYRFDGDEQWRMFNSGGRIIYQQPSHWRLVPRPFTTEGEGANRET